MEPNTCLKRMILAATLATPLLLNAQELNKPKIALHTWATGFSSPVVITNCGDSRLFVVEQAGVINIMTDSATTLPTPYLNISSEVLSGGEQGLLGLAFEPNYADSGYFYVYYIAGSGSGTSRISRFHVSADPNIADPASEQVIFEYPQPAANHNGGDLHFGPDGYLYLGLGDGGNANDTPQHTGQSLTDPLGGIIRIDVSQHNNTFAIPPDNPWANAGLDTLRENWMWGLRNPWRWSFDRLTGDVWIGDVGQNAWEEIDFRLAGDNSGPNFGWSCREGLVADAGSTQTGCHPASFYVSPVAVFSHSPQNWCAIIGGYVYRGTQYPHLVGHYIFTDYCAGDFLTFGLGTNYDQDTLLLTNTGGYAAFGEGSDGAIYVANVSNGQIKKIVDACPMAAPTVTNNGTTLTSTVANSYQWYWNGTTIAGATQQSFTPTTGGFYWVVAHFGAPCVLRSDTTTFLIAGIEEIPSDRIAVYPQPAKDEVVLERRSALDEDLTIDVFDALGRLVASSKWKANDVRTHLDISALPTSNYFIRALDRSGVARLSAPLLVTH